MQLKAHRNAVGHWGLATILAYGPVNALPVLDAPLFILDHKVYPDHEEASAFYVTPPPPRVSVDELGTPKVSLTLTYYTGTELREAAGENHASYLLSVQLERETLSDSLKRTIRSKLNQSIGVDSIALRDLPIAGMSTEVNYVPIDKEETTQDLGAGHLSSVESEPNSEWFKRNFQLLLSTNDGQVMRAAFEKSGAVMSISTAYKAVGVKAVSVTNLGTFDPIESVVSASAVRVRIDGIKHREHVKVIDLNGIVPPGYVGVSVLCHDFPHNSSDWLFEEKEVDFQAVGVTGNPIRTALSFPSADPEISLERATFPFAVRTDRPFRYRVRSYLADGGYHETEWLDQANWHVPLDITTYPEPTEKN